MLFFWSFILTLCAFSQEEEVLPPIQITHQGDSQAIVPFAPRVKVLKNKELQKRREISLGDTLRNEPGIQSSSYGPNASRPVIRGLDGDRIRILQNGLGVLDASSQSVDHAVPLDTMVIDSVEIVRGPTSMLYGTSAVGGVININTNRIHSDFEEGAFKEIQTTADSSQNAMSTSGRIDYGKNQWMIHFDGGYRNANDLRIPGKQKSSHVDLPGQFTSKNKLPNSGSVQKSAAVGASKIFKKGHVGMSYYFFDNYYGSIAEPNVDIKMKQNRFEFHSDYRFQHDTFKTIRFKMAQSDYGHDELDSGVSGTRFLNQGNESRLELLNERSALKGVSGFSTQIFNFKSSGSEAFLPATRNRMGSVFTLQEYFHGDQVYSFGARLETSRIQKESGAASVKQFNGLNSAIGLRHSFSETHTGVINVSYSERLPNFQELFANGFHVASGTFEQGNSRLNNEKAAAMDLGLNYKSDVVQSKFSVYAQDFQNYTTLFLTNTPSTEPGINISQFRQVGALFYGADLDAQKKLGDSPFNLLVKADWVRAKNKKDGTNLPRIAPPRLSLGLEMLKDRLSYDLEAQYNFEQTHTAPNETRTDAFTMLNAGVSYEFIQNSGKWNFFARLKNILNQEARLHSSTLKDIAPLAGRNIMAGTQYTF